MTTDVVFKPKSANPIKNGNLVTQCTAANYANFQTNNVDTADTDDRITVADTDLESNWTNRFDDVRYYTGDAAS